jgi:hypothetical protein
LLALACVDALKKAGVIEKQDVEDDNAENFTAVSIVASGVKVSPGSIRKWLDERKGLSKK